MKKFQKLFVVTSLCASVLGSSVNVYAAFNPNEGNGNLIIEEAGSYTLTGSMHGTVFVDPGAGEVELIMDNVQIDGGNTAGIIVVSGDAVKITAKDDTVNVISGMGADPDYSAAIYSNANMTFQGDGRLMVNCPDENGIHAEDADIFFDCGCLEIFCDGEGFMQDGGDPGEMFMNGGQIFVNGEEVFAETDDENDTNAAVPADYAISAPESVDEWIMTQAPDPFADTQQTQNTQQAPDQNNQQAPSQNAQQAPDQDNQQAPSQNAQQAPDQNNQQAPSQNAQQAPDQNSQQGPWSNGQQTEQGDMPTANIAGTLESADEAGEVVEGTTTNSAADLEADMENATYITISDDNSQVEISESGTYVVSGTSSDGNIVVKKGTTGVVLVLEDLDLTSTEGATLSANKNSEVKIIVSGNVTLTDAENPEDENSEDEEVADAYDGAAMKFKDGSSVYITGDGTLTLNGTAKNGIKTGDESSLVIDGDLTMNINAANDGINASYDVAILSGTLVISAVDDGIHADRILTIGKEDGTGPTIEIVESTEGLEGTVVNIFGGDITVNSSDDAINAANGDGLYEDVLTYSINMTGGTVDIECTGDGMDSNGNVNLIGGTATIQSGSTAGEAGIDYDGQLYVSDIFELYNNSGVSGADMMPGNMGGTMSGEMPSASANGTNTQNNNFAQGGTSTQNSGFAQGGTSTQNSGFAQGGTNTQNSGFAQNTANTQTGGFSSNGFAQSGTQNSQQTFGQTGSTQRGVFGR